MVWSLFTADVVCIGREFLDEFYLTLSDNQVNYNNIRTRRKAGLPFDLRCWLRGARVNFHCECLPETEGLSVIEDFRYGGEKSSCEFNY